MHQTPLIAPPKRAPPARCGAEAVRRTACNPTRCMIATPARVRGAMLSWQRRVFCSDVAIRRRAAYVPPLHTQEQHLRPTRRRRRWTPLQPLEAQPVRIAASPSFAAFDALASLMPAAPAARVYKGVVQLAPDSWAYVATVDGVERQFPGEPTARRAADAYDAVVRSQGSKVVNTVLYPSDIQAVAGEDESVTLARWRDAQQVKRELKQQQRPPPPPPLYRGVQRVGPKAFCAFAYVGLTRRRLGNYETAEEAAHAYDVEMRRQGILEVNFPRLPGQIKALPTALTNHAARNVPAPAPLSQSAPAAAIPADVPRAAAAPAQPPVRAKSEQSPADASARTHTSHYRGVHKSSSGQWKAQFSCGGKSIYIGHYGREEEAVRAFDRAVLWAQIHRPGRRTVETNFAASQYAADKPALRAISTLDMLIQHLRRVGGGSEAAPAPAGVAAELAATATVAAAPEEPPANASMLLRPRFDGDSGDGDAAAMPVSSSGNSRERRPSGYYAGMAGMASPPQRQQSTRCDECKVQKKGTCGTPSASQLCLNRTPDMPQRRESPSGASVGFRVAPAAVLPVLPPSEEARALAEPPLHQQAMLGAERRLQLSDPPPAPQPPPPVPQQTSVADPASPVSLKVRLRCSPPPNAKPAQQSFKSKEAQAAQFKGIVYKSGVFQVLNQPASLSFATAQAAADEYDKIQRSSNCRVVNTPLYPGEVKAVRHEKSTVTIRRAQEQQQQQQPRGGAGGASYAPVLVRLPPLPSSAFSQPGFRPEMTHEARSANAPPVPMEQRHFRPPPPPPPIVPPRSAAKRPLSEAAPEHGAAAAEPPSKRAHAAAPSSAAAPEAAPAGTETYEVVTFLRAIEPPLLNVDAVVAAAVDSGITLQMLRDACCGPSHGATNVQLICDILGITLGRDKLSLQLAIQKLGPQCC